MSHVKHMGFELELAHLKICQALACVPVHLRKTVIDHLRPVALQRAVRETMDD